MLAKRIALTVISLVVGIIAEFIVSSIMGCATATPVRGPDGGRWYNIECPGKMSRCWEEAAYTCPNGYHTASESHGVVGTYYDHHYKVQRETVRGEMLIKCK